MIFACNFFFFLCIVDKTFFYPSQRLYLGFLVLLIPQRICIVCAPDQTLIIRPHISGSDDRALTCVWRSEGEPP